MRLLRYQTKNMKSNEYWTDKKQKELEEKELDWQFEKRAISIDEIELVPEGHWKKIMNHIIGMKYYAGDN